MVRAQKLKHGPVQSWVPDNPVNQQFLFVQYVKIKILFQLKIKKISLCKYVFKIMVMCFTLSNLFCSKSFGKNDLYIHSCEI